MHVNPAPTEIRTVPGLVSHRLGAVLGGLPHRLVGIDEHDAPADAGQDPGASRRPASSVLPGQTWPDPVKRQSATSAPDRQRRRPVRVRVGARCAPSRPPESFQTDSTSASGLATTSIAKEPLPISRGELRECGEDAGGTDRTLSAAEEMNVGLAQRSGRECDAGPRDGSDLHPGDQPGTIVASGQQRHDRRFRRFAPEVVEHHVDVGRLGRQFVCDHLGIGRQVDGVVGTEAGHGGEPGRSPSGRHDRPGPEVLGDLDGELPGRAGGAEYQHRLPTPEIDPLLQRHPRGHARIRRGRQQERVGAGGEGMLRRTSMTVRSAMAP